MSGAASSVPTWGWTDDAATAAAASGGSAGGVGRGLPRASFAICNTKQGAAFKCRLLHATSVNRLVSYLSIRRVSSDLQAVVFLDGLETDEMKAERS